MNKAAISTSKAGEDGQAKHVLSGQESHTSRQDNSIAQQTNPILSGGESHTSRQDNSIAQLTNPILSEGESHTARQSNGIAQQTKPILSGGESHTARQSNGIAQQTKLVLSNFFQFLPYSCPALVLGIFCKGNNFELKSSQHFLFAPDILLIMSSGMQ